MKTIRTRLIGLLLPLAVSVISSCQKEVYRIKSGDTIEFTIGTVGNVMTRTAYSGTESDGRERIDWRSGDILRILCSQAATDDGNHYADYMVEKDGEADGAISKTTINVVEGDFGLKWSDAESFTFNAVYPSPETGNEGDSFGTGGSGGTGSSATTLTGHVPSAQGCTSASKNGTLWTAAPDMKSQYMIAKTTVANEGDVDDKVNGEGNVFLSFYPLTTAIRFTIENGTARTGEAGDMYIDAVSVISAGTRISGGFTASLADWDGGAAVPGCTATESGAVSDQEVKLDLSGKDVLLKDGDKLTFTLFLLPTQDVDDLSFKVYRHDKDGNRTWMSTRLAYNDAERTGVLFQKHKLTEVKGLLLPDGAQWQVKYSPDVDRWTSEDHGIKNPAPENALQPFVTSWEFGINTDVPMLKYNYVVTLNGETNFNHNGTALLPDGISDLELISTRELNHMTDPVVWYLEYLDESTGEWKVPEVNAKLNGLVTLDTVLGKGNQTIHMSVDAAEEPSESKPHTTRLLDSEPKGTETAPYDLSMYTIYGSPRAKAKTANCYIVKSQGWYAFPLVYGNAVDDNVAPAGYINVNAYNPGGEIDPTETILTRFKNCKGVGIRQPYIESDLETTCEYWTVATMWQDASFIDGSQILTASAAAGKGLTSMTGEGHDSNACGYVMFHVNENIQQGNAVIAVKDEDSNVVWSWHIWITDDELDLVSFRNYSGQVVNMLPVNLGWVDSDTAPINYYEGRSVRFRINQEGSNIHQEFTVTRRPETTETHVNGTSTYYQWGRKDPFENGKYSTATNAFGTDLAYSIKNPSTFVIGGSGYYNEIVASSAATYYNLWSALNKGLGTESSNYGSKTIKTIYDPCPPGFQIPHGIAFTGLTTTGANSGNSTDFNVSGVFNGGWFFETGAGDEKNFFKASGCISNSGVLNDTETKGWYWTSVPQQGSDFEIDGIEMDFASNKVNVVNSIRQSIGCTVRPVMEDVL